MSDIEEKKQLWIILLIVFMRFISTSIAYPIFAPLFLHPASNAIIPSAWHPNTRSIFLGVTLAAYPLGQFIGSALLGGCSDRYGRKRMLILSLIGSVLGYFLSALSLQFNWLWILVLSRFLTGFMEGNLAIFRAIATDFESISKYLSIGRIHGIAAIGYIIGPLLGGLLSDNTILPWFSFALPFFLAMLLCMIAIFLTFFTIFEKMQPPSSDDLTLRQRLNVISRFKVFFHKNETLKYLFIISTIFTFSVDIFYEFGPAYLTSLWSMTPTGIAIYNAVLSLALAAGASWIPHRLSFHFSIKRVTTGAIFITAIIYGLMVVFPIKVFALLLFGIIGLSIAVVTTNMTIQISNSANKTVQGEVMGVQLSLRMLGDAIICLAGGFLIVSSVLLPIVVSCLIAVWGLMVYITKLRSQSVNT